MKNKKTFDMALFSGGVKDLQDTRETVVEEAAFYFFTDGGRRAEDHGFTFNSLCARNRLDPNAAAKAVWEKLNPQQQEFVRQILHQAKSNICFCQRPSLQERRKLAERRKITRYRSHNPATVH